MPTTHRLTRSQSIARPLDEVFAFFSDATNLETITPPFLRFRIVTPLPIEMRAGTRIEYARFVDEQEAGPYAHWRHVHEFEAEGHGTRMTDTVTYRLPFGTLGALAHPLWVERQLDAIFDYREQAVLRRLGSNSGGPSRAEPEPGLQGAHS
jgi:ligand-binding SRPBCC domain-containing protein